MYNKIRFLLLGLVIIVLSLVGLCSILSCTGPAGKDGKSVNSDSLKTVIYNQMKSDPTFKGVQGIQGPRGVQGISGTNGADFDTSLVRPWFEDEIEKRFSAVDFDSICWAIKRLSAIDDSIAILKEKLQRLYGPKALKDSLGNTYYEVFSNQKFVYHLRHNFKDTLGVHEWRIKFFVELYEYNSLNDLLLNKSVVKHTFQQNWHDYEWDRFLRIAETTPDGLYMSFPVTIVFPNDDKFYDIVHYVVDASGNRSKENHSMKEVEAYYVRTKR